MPDNTKVVDPIDPDRQTSELLGSTSEPVTVQMEQQHDKCYWNDVEFSPGDRVMQDSDCYECSFGRWILVDD